MISREQRLSQAGLFLKFNLGISTSMAVETNTPSRQDGCDRLRKEGGGIDPCAPDGCGDRSRIAACLHRLRRSIRHCEPIRGDARTARQRGLRSTPLPIVSEYESGRGNTQLAVVIRNDKAMRGMVPDGLAAHSSEGSRHIVHNQQTGDIAHEY